LLAVLMTASLLAGCGKTVQPEKPENADPEPAQAETVPADASEGESEQAKEENGDKVAGADDMTEVEDVVEEGMVPVYADSLKDGVYPVEMKSSSSMFKVDHCELIVENGTMSAVLYMTSEAYPYMFADKAEKAAAASEDEYILPVEIGDGTRSFTLPIEALDAGVDCAAFSKRKELWYDRTLLFRADSLPEDAFADGFFTTAESLALEDGEYTVEVALSGGSGKASVTSPAKLHVSGGAATADIEWSSPNYDYMKVGEEKYLPVNTEGNSCFTIPVGIFDRPMTVYADTTAMSEPHEIEYTLTFDSATVNPAG